MQRPAPLVLLLAATFTPNVATAHLELMSPASRYGGDILKTAPCGQAGGTRGTNVITYAPGEKITLTWNEYIDHPGHYRIAFDEDGDDDFRDPTCTAGCDTTSPTIETYGDATVLLDGIADRVGGDYEVEVTLPNVECDRCTIQVIQVMYDKPPYTSPGNDIYYQCIDVVIGEGGGGGCVCVRGRGGGVGVLVLGFAFLGWLVRGRARVCA